MSARAPERGLDDAAQRELLRRARSVLSHAHAPYSGFGVGAALLADDGTVFTGVNVENVSYGLTLCAERAALCAAVGAGRRAFRAIAIATDPAMPCTPCGACRQVLAEFGEMLVIFQADDGTRVLALSSLLPEAFRALPPRA